MTNTPDQSSRAEATIPSPLDIAAVTMLPPDGRAPPSPAVTSRQHQSEIVMTASTVKFASESHDYVREYIRNADQKAIFYFSVCSALLAFEHSQNWAQQWTKLPSMWTAGDLLTCASMTGLAIAAASFLFVVFPRLGGSPRGLIFFRSVATYPTADEYVADVARRSDIELTTEKLRHCYELAKVASSKYSFLSFGLRVGGVAILCSLLLLVASPPQQPAPGRSSISQSIAK
jgi:hypothetical protein